MTRQKIMPQETIEKQTMGAPAYHIGAHFELPFAGPYTSARYEVIALSGAGIDTTATLRLVPGQRFE
jgi:hypothetical protein